MENNTIPISISELKQKKIPELMDMATSLNIENATSMKNRSSFSQSFKVRSKKSGLFMGQVFLKFFQKDLDF